MRNFRLTLEYDGTNYNGWQMQSRAQRKKDGRVKTVQGVFEDALFNIFSKRIKVASCSRTDSGVHAKAHVVNFKTETLLDARTIGKALSSLLPDDIIVKDVKEVDVSFNAQYDALNKTYRYSICDRDVISPFIRNYVYHFRQPLNIDIMRQEAKALLGKHDFSAFTSSNRGNGGIRNPVRTILALDVHRRGGIIQIDIQADGFSYRMVRNIVGSLIEVGRGRFPAGSIRKILDGKDRKKAGPAVPSNGLCLIDVTYPKNA